MARISNKDLQNATGKQSGNKVDKQEKEDTRDVVMYTMFGDHSALDDNDNPLTENDKLALAKRTKVGKTYQYWVKGDGNGHFLNPLGLFSAYERQYDSTKGKMLYKFIKCNRLVFDYYVSFLRTKNSAWLKHAEREV